MVGYVRYLKTNPKRRKNNIDVYTHNFSFEVDSAGGQFIKGEVEFDTDGKVSFKIKDSSSPLQAETLSLFTNLFEYLKKIYDLTGGIVMIKVSNKKKELEKANLTEVTTTPE